MVQRASKQETRKVHIKNVGEVLLQRSRRAKHICLSVRPFKGVRIAVPYGVSFQSALAVAHDKAQWLEKHIRRMARIEAAAVHFNTPSELNRHQARKILVQRLEQVAAFHGFVYNKVFVRNQKTRWGSCSARNNISLNVNLVRLPAELMDYVILHELVHTRIKNHSRQFWVELGKYVAAPKTVDKQLRGYEAMLLLNDQICNQ